MNRLKIPFIFLMLFFALSSHGASTTQIKVGGRIVPLWINEPESKGKVPLLVIAPAKKYLSTESLYSDLATRAAAKGYYVVRMDWGFVATHQESSPNLKNEADELIAVIKKYKALNNIDPKRIVLAAKSFGSKVAMLGAYKEVKSLLLITPNCDEAATFEKTYSPLFTDPKATHISISVNDPYCDVNQIYTAMPQLGKNVTLQTTLGDHNFLTSSSDLNQKTALDGMIGWLSQQLIP